MYFPTLTKLYFITYELLKHCNLISEISNLTTGYCFVLKTFRQCVMTLWSIMWLSWLAWSLIYLICLTLNKQRRPQADLFFIFHCGKKIFWILFKCAYFLSMVSVSINYADKLSNNWAWIQQYLNKSLNNLWNLNR